MIEQGFSPELVIVNEPRDTEKVWYPSVAELADREDIPVHRASRPHEQPQMWVEIERIGPELFVLSSFRNILTEHQLNIPSKGAINLHMAPLPKFRGAHPENWAMLLGERRMGFTVHYLDLGIDSGDIIAQDDVPILDSDDILSLTFRLADHGPALLVKVLQDVKIGKVQRVSQNVAEASYYPVRTEKDGKISWDVSAVEIRNLIRAVTRPYPGAFTTLDGHKLIIWAAEVCSGSGAPGTVLRSNRSELIIATNENAVVTSDYEWITTPKYNDLVGKPLE